MDSNACLDAFKEINQTEPACQEGYGRGESLYIHKRNTAGDIQKASIPATRIHPGFICQPFRIKNRAAETQSENAGIRRFGVSGIGTCVGVSVLHKGRKGVPGISTNQWSCKAGHD